MIAALAGGVGSARFLAGLLQVVDPRDVVIVGNTGDDDWFHGLRVCPDLDSVTYALAGANNPETGWGLAGETFATLGALERYGVPTWFNIGDRDFATHLYRTERLRAGDPLSAVTADIAAAWGLACRLLPMTDDAVATRITAAMPRRRRRARARGVVRAGALRAAGGLGALRRRRVGTPGTRSARRLARRGRDRHLPRESRSCPSRRSSRCPASARRSPPTRASSASAT